MVAHADASTVDADYRHPFRVAVVGRVTGSSGVLVLVICLAMAGSALALGPVRQLGNGRGSLGLALVMGLMFALAELYPVHLHRGRDTHSFSLSEIPLVLGLVVLEPGLLVAARVIGAGVVLVVARRQRRIKLGFNLAHLLVEVSLAAVVFNAIADAEMSVTDAWTWIAAYAAAATTHLYGWIAISAVISISEAELQLADIRSTLTAGAGAVVMNTSLAVLGVIASDANRLALVPVIVLAAMSAVSYRSYSVLRRGHGRLEMLYDFTGALGHTVVLEEAVSVVLSEARTALRAAQAGVVWVDEQSGAATMWWLADGKAQRRLLSIDETETSWWSPVLSGDCIAPSSPKQRRGRAAKSGRLDGLAAPLRSEHRIDGVLIVSERIDEVSMFTREDQDLLAALSNHAQVALANGRLLETRHQAFHDPLTGLPNRRVLATAIEQALTTSEDSVALLIIDLDGFKDVNDALGHSAGDIVLIEVSKRLTAAIPDGATLARLGGDEFCIVIPGIADPVEATNHAERILAAIRQPQEISGNAVAVGASIGIAIAGHDDDATRLFDNADTAMYTAKERKSSIEFYATGSNSSSFRRLELTSALRPAIEYGDIDIHYQPKVDLLTGRPIGAEALVRWTHPALGTIPADEFIMLAERTGLICPLTSAVLETAVAECARWRQTNSDFTVAVNISERNLLDINFPAEVDRVLRRSGLDPDGLVLEISERADLRQIERLLNVVDRIRMLGVAVSLDDFGTGQSSFAHLKVLPVDELKLDRSFVTTIAMSRIDRSIVQSAINLAHELGMRVVAEGVEDQAAWSELVRLGCDQAQGYLLAHPMPPALFDTWLRQHSGAARSSALPLVAASG